VPRSMPPHVASSPTGLRTTAITGALWRSDTDAPQAWRQLEQVGAEARKCSSTSVQHHAAFQGGRRHALYASQSYQMILTKGKGMRKLSAIMVFVAACVNSAPTAEISQSSLGPGEVWCGDPDPTSLTGKIPCTIPNNDYCRSQCSDPGMPYTSRCAHWGEDTGTAGYCAWTPH
jgi:hypothetical protein